jgi:hypothetical protein
MLIIVIFAVLEQNNFNLKEHLFCFFTIKLPAGSVIFNNNGNMF